VIGGGIVGFSTAYHLAQKGWTDIALVEQGPLFEAGGSTSHAPGLVFQTNGSRTICELAQQTVKLYSSLSLGGQPCFHSVGSMEVAITPQRLEDLKRRHGWATSWGLPSELITPAEAKRRLPLLDDRKILGAYAVPSDGLAKAVRACEAMARSVSGPLTWHARTTVTGFEIASGKLVAIVTDRGRIETNLAILCGGIWGPRVAKLAGVRVPLMPVQHQYVRTSRVKELTGETREVVHPILCNQDRAMYFRQHADCYGVGSYQHEPLLVESEKIRKHEESAMPPASMPFTPEHFVKPWQDACELLPPLRATETREKFNGMFSFTPDGLPVLGESHVGGLWIAEAVWVTHGGGVGKVMAEWLVDGAPSLDLRECDINRFDPHATSPSYVRARGAQQYREVYDVIHPLQQMEQPRPLRTSPFYIRQKELGATFFEGRGWERPQWFASNEKLVTSVMRSKRSGWAAQNWSPIAAAEHLATRDRVAMFDMTPLVRLEVTGRDALTLLQSLSTNQLAKPVGSVVYACFCDARGGVKSDVTITRLAEDHFQVGCNGLPDLAWIRAHIASGADVQVRDITPGTCCVGVWGPRARDLVQPLSADDFSNGGFRYFTARRVHIGEVPVMAQRVSYVGELGWEMYTTSDYGMRLWDLLWRSGQPLGVIAAGRAAFESLRIEKGYRLWGVDMYTDHDPYESGLGFTVKLDKGEFIGRAALAKPRQSRKLCCLTIDDGTVLMGKEPVFAQDRVVGYVTSATYGFAVDRSIAYAYVPVELAREGSIVEVEYFNKRHRATVASDPLYDPKGSKLRN